jgi:hypothetical protein
MKNHRISDVGNHGLHSRAAVMERTGKKKDRAEGPWLTLGLLFLALPLPG